MSKEFKKFMDTLDLINQGEDPIPWETLVKNHHCFAYSEFVIQHIISWDSSISHVWILKEDSSGVTLLVDGAASTEFDCDCQDHVATLNEEVHDSN